MAQGQPTKLADLTTPQIPDDQNSAILYEKAFKIVKNYYAEPSNAQYSMFKPVIQHEQYITDQMARNYPVDWVSADNESRALAGIVPLVEQSLSKPGFHMNLDYNADDPYGWGIQKMIWESSLQDLIRLLAFQTMVDAHYGRKEQACHKAIVILRTTKIFRNHPTSASMIVETAINHMATDSVYSLVRNCTLTPAQAAELNRYLSASNHADEVVPAITNVRAGNLWRFSPRRPSDVNTEFWAADYGKKKPWWSASKVMILNKMSAPLLYTDGIVYINGTNKMLAVMTAPGKPMPQRRRELCRIFDDIPRYASVSSNLLQLNLGIVDGVMKDRARTALTQVAIAAQQYRQQHGAYPDTLAQLRSNSKLSIPLDPFTDKELVYQRTSQGYLVYSVGKNQIDDGGQQAAVILDDKYDDIVLNWRW